MIPRLHSALVAALLLTSAAVGCGGGSTPTDVALDPGYYGDLYDYDNADTLLGRGINMGDYLEGDPTEGSWSRGRLITQDDFALIKAVGFKSVRLPVRWSAHADDASPYEIDAVWLARVKQVIDWALAEDLNVVVNTHHYNELFSAGTPEALTLHEERLHAIWSQLCDAFGTTAYPTDRVVFELLNEPNGALDYDEWNTVLADLTTLIRTTKGQSSRVIMIGTANWGGPTGLSHLTLPASTTPSNTIVTVHWYEPFHFTHQCASDWVPGSDAWAGTIWRGTSADQQPLLDLLDPVTTWNAESGRGFEVYVGEFGAYSKCAGAEYRKAWTAFIAREAEARGMSWAYWEFDQGFGAYDRQNLQWRPEILDALIPLVDRPAL